MLQDCKSRDIEIIITKNINRFGRDRVEILDFVGIVYGKVRFSKASGLECRKEVRSYCEG
jgi:hypothetical protein